MHRMAIRIYYEDTDLAGIVYHANYLKFTERARTEWARGLGVDQGRLKAGTGTVLAVRRVVADYLLPARFDDIVEVRTTVQGVTAARMDLVQEIWRGTARLFASQVMIVALRADGRPVRLPDTLRGRLSAT